MSELTFAEYKIIMGTTDQLNTQVNKEIKAGFQPFGSPFYCNQQVAQAMVKPPPRGPAGYSGQKASDFGAGT